MKAALINAGPMERDSPSAAALEELGALLPKEADVITLSMCHTGIDGELLSQLAGCDVWVLSFELLADGVPSHLLRCLMVLERFFGCCPHRKTTVYALVSCGCYEGAHTQAALSIMKNWCEQAKLCWGQGAGIGGSGLLFGGPAIPGMRRGLRAALTELAAHAAKEEGDLPDRFVTASLPRFAYLLAVERAWRQALRRGEGAK